MLKLFRTPIFCDGKPISSEPFLWLIKEKENEKKARELSAWQSYLGVLRDWRVWLLVLAYSGTSSIWWGTVTWLPSYLKEARGFSWTEMGIWASLPYIMAVLVKLFAGWAVDRFNKPELLLVVGLFGSAVFIYMGAYAQGGVSAILLITAGIGMLAIGTPSAWYLLQQIVSAMSDVHGRLGRFRRAGVPHLALCRRGAGGARSLIQTARDSMSAGCWVQIIADYGVYHIDFSITKC